MRHPVRITCTFMVIFFNSGIVIVDDDLTIDRETELEERRAYLEEARSQEASSD